MAAFDDDNSTRRCSELDRLIDILPAGERIHVIHNLIVRSAAGDAPKKNVLDYVVNSRHAAKLPDPAERLKLLALTAMLLTDGQGQVVNQASHEIGDKLADSSAHGNGPVWSGLLSDSRKRISDMRESLTAELENQRSSYEDQLAEMRAEQKRLQGRVEGLRAQIAARREESRLDIRHDMLLVIGETLQSFRQRKGSPEELLRHIEARLSLALRAGGAEEFGTIGETVLYNPRFHQVEKQTPNKSPVRVSAPGAIVRGKLTGDRVLIKARVVYPSEVN